jgi:hypothetical protein
LGYDLGIFGEGFLYLLSQIYDTWREWDRWECVNNHMISKREVYHMANDSISRQFVTFVDQLAYENFSENQVYKVKSYFLDWLGYAGQSQPR